MTKEPLLTFQKFNDKQAALDLAALLKKGNIAFELVDNTAGNDVSFGNNNLAYAYSIKINANDFSKANDLIQKNVQVQVDAVDKDYFLFNFSNQELVEVIQKKDEWGPFNVLLAQKIMKDRGNEIKPEEVEKLNKQRIDELTKPEVSQKFWIYAGYTMALLGGFVGILIGWHLLTNKRTLPNGKTIYDYTASDRKHGNRIVIIGVVCFVIWMSIRIINFFIAL